MKAEHFVKYPIPELRINKAEKIRSVKRSLLFIMNKCNSINVYDLNILIRSESVNGVQTFLIDEKDVE